MMWPLHVLCMCLLALVSVRASESSDLYNTYNPRFLVGRPDSDQAFETIRPMFKRQTVERRRDDQFLRSRCFFNPITC
ncbi:unnamed protein product [Cylicocyclus nassatus]|uniref:Uncharacterized protein n=1 Tax=Cylicocyclus nassatus TaxID=53992 RepID=A0AA36DUI2_CYLNA|nr:unnamed protein product [Cylicocyclus nassatus]